MDATLELDPETYARALAALKDADSDSIGRATRAIHGALDCLYRAVALDIDGTLTVGRDSDLNDEVASLVRRLLRRGIPIILITGRGDSAVDVMRRLQAERLDQSPGRLHCIIRNGAAELSPSPEFQEKSLASIPLPWDATWDVIDSLRPVPDRCSPPDRRAGPRDALRLEYSENGNRDAAISELKERFKESVVRVKAGSYGAIETVDLSTTSKAEALDTIAKRIGLSAEEILRIGDRGEPGGNDYELLDSVAGFTVDRFSRQIDHCHPVIGSDGDRLTWAKGTVALLQGVTLSPPVRRIAETVDESVVERLAVVERKAITGAAPTLSTTTDRLASSLLHLVDIGTGLIGPPRVELGDLFDPSSGAVRLRDAEYHEILRMADHEAVALLGLTDLEMLEDRKAGNPHQSGAMLSDSGVLLRGSLYYFGEVVRPHSHRVRDYLLASAGFLAASLPALDRLAEDDPSISRFKLVLGIADHVRNIVLQTVYLIWSVESQSGEYQALPGIVNLARDHTRAHLRLLLRNVLPWSRAIGEYADALGPINEAVAGLATPDSLLAPLDETSPLRGLIRLRECDNFLLNVSAVGLALEHHAIRLGLRRGDELTCYGLPYGGIELPVLAAELGSLSGFTIHPGYVQVSFYGDEEAARRWRERRTRSCHELRETSVRWEGSVAASDRILIADDNVTTGNSLQHAIDLLAVQELDVAGAIMVQYPMANRKVHMRLGEGRGGCPDPDALLGFISGLVAPTPYTRLLVPGEGDDTYRDREGVFNKAKRRISRMLFKNYLKDDPT